jgi:hypothetical protein
VTYIASLGGARWENWRSDWVIASAEVSDRLTLPSDGPSLERKQWRVKPCLVPEFKPVLDRIRELAVGGLTSMHVLGDFLSSHATAGEAASVLLVYRPQRHR